MPLVLDVAIRGLVAMAAVFAFARLQGLRSFSKMSSFDFPLTVAFGSIIGGAMLAPSTPWTVALYAIALVFAVQTAIALARRRWPLAQRIADNEPVLVMENGRILDGGLARAQMTTDDLWAKLRAANVHGPDRVRAVVVESTGDVSVMHDTDGPADLAAMLKDVRRV